MNTETKRTPGIPDRALEKAFGNISEPDRCDLAWVPFRSGCATEATIGNIKLSAPNNTALVTMLVDEILKLQGALKNSR